MKRTAGILKAFATIAMILVIVMLVILVIAEAALLIAGPFSSLAEKTGSAITIEGGTMTPAELDALKPIIMIAVAAGIAALIFTIMGIQKTRKALAECKEERPFSAVCVKAVRDSARLEIIGGIVGIIASIILSLMVKSLTVNGTPVGRSSASLNLTFLVYAIQKYLLFHVAEYGHSLETDPQKQ